MHFYLSPVSLVTSVIASVAFSFACDLDATAETLPSKPNVVLILADDLGFTDLSCMGSDLHQTPNLDNLVKRSLMFTRAYAQPTCSPSRAAILSGKNPARLGIVGHGVIRSVSGGGDFLVSQEYTIAEALHDGGYNTCHIGKWHVGINDDTVPEAQGFQKVIASNDFCCPGSFHYPFRDKRKKGKQAQRSAVPYLGDYKPGDHLSYCLGEEAAKYIASRKGEDKPFFLNLWYYAVHTPIEANREKVQRFKSQVVPGANHTNAAYAGLVSHLDDSVGRVLKALEENGFSKNTIVIFYSDNGGEIRNGVTSNAPLRAGKTTVYEGGTRVPLAVYWPGVIAGGAKCDYPVVGHDLYPTLLSATGVLGSSEQNDAMDGLDLSPLLSAPGQPMPSRSIKWLRYGESFHYPSYGADPVFGPSAAIVKGDWKMMVRRFPTPHSLSERFELYNLAVDPYEKNDISSAKPKTVASLTKELTDWQSEINIPSYRELAYPVFEKLKLKRKGSRKKR